MRTHENMDSRNTATNHTVAVFLHVFYRSFLTSRKPQEWLHTQQFTLSLIEKLGILSKAEELGLLSLLETVAGYSPAALASTSLPVLVAAILTVVLIPDDSTALVVAQTVVAGTLAATATGLFVGSIVLEGLQEAD